MMDQKVYSHTSVALPYYVQGKRPGLLLLSGAHGDEYEVIASVHKSVDALENKLPDFLYIPEVSPSSVASRCRANFRDKDINRQFFDGTDCVEAQAVMELLSQYQVAACVSFHEDPTQEQFYLYDTGEFSEGELSRMRDAVKACGVELFSGIDDPEDEYLGFEFREGYCPHVGSDGTPRGPLETWLIREGIAKRVFGVEVPGRVAAAKKDRVVTCVLELLAKKGIL